MEEKVQKKSQMSIIFPPAILGSDMAAPISWGPGNFRFFHGGGGNFGVFFWGQVPSSLLLARGFF